MISRLFSSTLSRSSSRATRSCARPRPHRSEHPRTHGGARPRAPRPAPPGPRLVVPLRPRPPPPRPLPLEEGRPPGEDDLALAAPSPPARAGRSWRTSPATRSPTPSTTRRAAAPPTTGPGRRGRAAVAPTPRAATKASSPTTRPRPTPGCCPAPGCGHVRPFYRAVTSSYFCPRCEEAADRRRSYLRATERRSGRVLHEGGPEPSRPVEPKRLPKYLCRPPAVVTRPFARRPKRRYACAACCRRHAGGRVHSRFELKIVPTR